MIYSPDAFNALFLEIERQGGALLPDSCESQDIKFVAPPYDKTHVERRCTCGCNNQSRFVSNYDPEPKSKRNPAWGSSQKNCFITACAVCDDMGAWPRFEDAVNEADPDMNRVRRDPEDEE